MKGYKFANMVILVVLSTSLFASSFDFILHGFMLVEHTTILDSHTPRLGEDDTAFVKFKNSTGIYLTENGKTIVVESFKDPDWLIKYREKYQVYLKEQEQQQKVEEFRKTAEWILGLIATPIYLLLSPLGSTFAWLETGSMKY